MVCILFDVLDIAKQLKRYLSYSIGDIVLLPADIPAGANIEGYTSDVLARADYIITLLCIDTADEIITLCQNKHQHKVIVLRCDYVNEVMMPLLTNAVVIPNNLHAPPIIKTPNSALYLHQIQTELLRALGISSKRYKKLGVFMFKLP